MLTIKITSHCLALLSMIGLLSCGEVEELPLYVECLGNASAEPLVIDNSSELTGYWRLHVDRIVNKMCVVPQPDDLVRLDGFDIGPLALETKSGEILYSLGEVSSEKAGVWRVGKELRLEIDLGKSDDDFTDSLTEKKIGAITKLVLNAKNADSSPKQISGRVDMLAPDDSVLYEGSFSLLRLNP